jgi:hypothetical protein
MRHITSSGLLALMTLTFLYLYTSADFSQPTPAPNLDSMQDLWDTLYYILEAAIFFIVAFDKTVSTKSEILRIAWGQMAVFTFVRLLWELKSAETGRSVNEKEIMLVFSYMNLVLLVTIPCSIFLRKLYINIINFFIELWETVFQPYIKKAWKSTLSFLRSLLTSVSGHG